MSVKIWCECVVTANGIMCADSNCPSCHGLGFEERGCENCYCKDDCEIRLMPLSEGKKIDYCTAWEAKQ